MKLPLTGAIALLAAPLFAVSAMAADPDGDGAKKAAETEMAEKVDKAEEPKQICRRIRGDMSSRRSTKVCMTQEEWKAWNEAQRSRQR